MAIPFDECSVQNGSRLLTIGEDEGNDDDATVTTLDTNAPRKPGPIDTDTCQPAPHNLSETTDTYHNKPLTPNERHNLRAMHTLGTTHLLHNEYPQAISIFIEILRGHTARHRKNSIQSPSPCTTSAYCMKCNKYRDCEIVDGAARLRIDLEGLDNLGVATCANQVGVACMALHE